MGSVCRTMRAGKVAGRAVGLRVLVRRTCDQHATPEKCSHLDILPSHRHMFELTRMQCSTPNSFALAKLARQCHFILRQKPAIATACPALCYTL